MEIWRFIKPNIFMERTGKPLTYTGSRIGRRSVHLNSEGVNEMIRIRIETTETVTKKCQGWNKRWDSEAYLKIRQEAINKGEEIPSQYDYFKSETEEEVTTLLFEQSLDSADVKAVIYAINFRERDN